MDVLAWLGLAALLVVGGIVVLVWIAGAAVTVQFWDDYEGRD